MSTAAAATPIVSVPKKYGWFRIILILLGIAMIFALIYWIYNITRVSWGQIKDLITQDAAKMQNPAYVERILLSGAKEIVYDPQLLSQAKEYSKQSGIPLERVIVNNALSLAKSMNFI